jgi:hypothetical protein
MFKLFDGKAVSRDIPTNTPIVKTAKILLERFCSTLFAVTNTDP